MNRAPVKGRLLGLALSGLVHLGLVVAVIALVRGVDPPMLFVDLAHGLDLAEHAVAGLGRAVADARSHVAPRAEGSRGKPDGGSRGRAARSPAPPPPSTVTEPTEPRRAEAPAPPATPEPAPPAAEPRPTSVPAAPQPRVVDPSPSALASAAGDTTAPAEPPVATRSTGAGDSTGRGPSGVGASGHEGSNGAVSLSDAGGGGGQGGGARSRSRDGSPLALAMPGGGGGSGYPAAADYAGYYDTLRRRLYESLTYPPLARRRGLSGTVLVDVEIDASGRLGRVTLVTSSSHALLDDAALEAVRGVSRVPFPPGVPPRRLLVRLPVVFEMR
jgi:protein TonB